MELQDGLVLQRSGVFGGTKEKEEVGSPMFQNFKMPGSVGAFVFLSVLFISIHLVSTLIGKTKKYRFSRRYQIRRLPKGVKIKMGRRPRKNRYILNYPFWASSKKDGTADLRMRDNEIIWGKSFLFVDGAVLEFDKPYELLGVVKDLRRQGVEIQLSKEEKEKYAKLKKKRAFFAQGYDIQKIIDSYEEHPTDFEKLCALLFQKMGYHTQVTAKSNDGGYDIVLWKNQSKAIVECKCYSAGNKIGRPAIQKLVGANNTALADGMVFITTSEFSSYAVSYAKEAGVELVDGRRLLSLFHEYLFTEEQGGGVYEEECYLEVSDLRPYVPEDIYEDYFVQC